MGVAGRRHTVPEDFFERLETISVYGVDPEQ